MSAIDFETLVNQFIHITSERDWNSNFGVNSTIISLIWHKIQNRKFKPIHLLWTLQFLRSYNTYDQGCHIWQISEKTYSYWIWIVVQSLYDSLSEVII